MSKFTFSQFIYLDTNIISHIAKNRSIWSQLIDFLYENDLCIGINVQFAELCDAKSLHRNIAELFMFLPSASIKTFEEVVYEEIKSHPQIRSDSLLLLPYNQLPFEDGKTAIEDFLKSPKLREVRKNQLRSATQFRNRHYQLKLNFPPPKSGNYTRQQADEFAWMWVIQYLAIHHPDFMISFNDKMEEFHPDAFLSLRLIALVLFYKYYLGRRDPKKLSDFADLFHLYVIPYCKTVIMERDLCNIMHQIRSHHNILETTSIYNIDFFKNWK
ncbi:MAG: hypothetical protein HXS54_00520 [Theionarchaea archaeon]|nr:hypothetical protein [Theionarchaea archaeon]